MNDNRVQTNSPGFRLIPETATFLDLCIVASCGWIFIRLAAKIKGGATKCVTRGHRRDHTGAAKQRPGHPGQKALESQRRITTMKTKRVLCPERLRHVPHRFSWIDQRLVREGHIARCGPEALATGVIRTVPTSSRFRVVLDTNRCSVPSLYASLPLLLKTFADRLPCPAAACFLRSTRPLGFCRPLTFRNWLCSLQPRTPDSS